MHHRYGRHGPRAWLRRRERRYPLSLLPVLAQSEVTAVYVHVPANVERIIFIFMNNPASDERGQELQIVNALPPPYASLLPPNGTRKLSPGDTVVTEKAQCRAIDDAIEVRKLDRDENFVVIDWARAGDRAIDIAQEEVKAYRATLQSLAPEEYKRLSTVYQSAYLAYLESEINNETENVSYLKNPREVQIRNIAIQDRNAEPNRRDYHIRDLAVVRVLSEFGVTLESAPDRLPDLHKYIDKYQAYYTNPRKEVEWPTQKSFRSE